MADYGTLKDGESVNVTLPPGQRHKLRMIAAKLDIKLADYLRQLIEFAIEEEFEGEGSSRYEIKEKVG